MRIYLASYQSIMLNRGGPTYKILHIKQALEELGVDVRLFNMWDFALKLTKDDLVHIFLANISTYSLASNLKLYGAKYVVNPIIFSNHPAWKLRLYQNLEKPLNRLFRLPDRSCSHIQAAVRWPSRYSPREFHHRGTIHK